ncbi:CPBP family intramembrane glutamic endopeptidase [Alishewanella sp. d11]|uniref:CPBP family intramembrane glutamic endopeptidase n=1 Tax=Alishewanella sp. d11 TaxID=3414030 RepID=UPI003BF789BA
MVLAVFLFSGFKFTKVKINFALHNAGFQHYFKYFLLLVGLYIFFTALITLYGLIFSGSEQALSIDRAESRYDGVGNFYLYIVMTVFIVPIVEELMFRGYFQTKLISVFRNAQVRYVIVSLFFTLMHFSVSFYTLAKIFSFSILVCWVREHSNSVYPAILLHMIFNAIGLIALTYIT